jgi:outer membrane receptor for monomeric catechols
VQLASYLDLPRHFQFDSFAYFTGTLPALWGQPIPVPNYWRADARLGWNPVRWLDISISGQNLTTPRHLEQVSYHLAQPLEVRRSVLAAVRWMF